MADMRSTFKLPAFLDWLVARGALVDTPTSEWEILRYRFAGVAPRILYRNKAGRLTISKEISADYDLFLNETGAGGEQAVEKMRRAYSRPMREKIASRDALDSGALICCYCGQFLTIEEATIEHFVPVSKGGTNHAHNTALACEACNITAGDAPVMTKILMRDRIREAISDIPPWTAFDARQIGGRTDV